jgi:hypothetical protein
MVGHSACGRISMIPIEVDDFIFIMLVPGDTGDDARNAGAVRLLHSNGFSMGD